MLEGIAIFISVWPTVVVKRGTDISCRTLLLSTYSLTSTELITVPSKHKYRHKLVDGRDVQRKNYTREE